MTAKFESEPPVRTRSFGRVNWLGLWSLIVREVLRFSKLWIQTVLAPVVTACLFVTVFNFALAAGRPGIFGIPFIEFLAPGMVMMAVIQNSFQNTATSILHAKIMGNIFDTLVAPLSAGELNFGYAVGGVVRGVAVALATSAVLFPLVGTGIAHPFWAAYFILAGACLLSTVGIVAGIWGERFDHLATVTNFLIIPLSFLSGTFFSVSALPEPWSTVSRWNPFFYLIDGFRFGVVGVSDAEPMTGLVVTLFANVLLWLFGWHLFRIGYRLKE